MITEIVLVVMMGYSPPGASGVDMEILEYIQPNSRICQIEKKRINELKLYPFAAPKAFCIERIK